MVAASSDAELASCQNVAAALANYLNNTLPTAQNNQNDCINAQTSMYQTALTEWTNRVGNFAQYAPPWGQSGSMDVGACLPWGTQSNAQCPTGYSSSDNGCNCVAGTCWGHTMHCNLDAAGAAAQMDEYNQAMPVVGDFVNNAACPTVPVITGDMISCQDCRNMINVSGTSVLTNDQINQVNQCVATLTAPNATAAAPSPPPSSPPPPPPPPPPPVTVTTVVTSAAPASASSSTSSSSSSSASNARIAEMVAGGVCAVALVAVILILAL